MENELISIGERNLKLEAKYLPDLSEVELCNYQMYSLLSLKFTRFCHETLNISIFVPAIKVGDKWEVLEMPNMFKYFEHRSTWYDETRYDWVEDCEQYQTAQSNVIFEGCYIDEWGTIITRWRDLYIEDLKDLTIQDLIKYKPTLTKKGVEVSGLNR